MAQLQLVPKRHAEALSQCIRALPIDGVYVNLCLSAEQAASTVHSAGRYRVRLDDCLDVEFAETDVAAIKRTEIQDLDDDRITTAELFHPGMLETFQATPPEIRDEAAVCVGLTGAFSQLGFLIGLEKLMLAMVDRPAAVHRAIRRRQAVALRQAGEICRAGARFIWIGEGMASGSLISRPMYTDFVLPYEQELADEIRRLGALSLLHICGNITPSLPEIAESRADGIDVDSLADWAMALSVLGPRMCVKGNISPLLFLPKNMEGLAAACEATRRLAARARGFILSTGCLVPRDSTVEAFHIMARASSDEKGLTPAN
jgi:uroporphyrinogen-III decarboxylase